jgi:phage terminase large subunit-like protein
MKELIDNLSLNELINLIDTLSIEEINAMAYDWGVFARNSQQQPAGNWFTWLVLAGRGWG